MTRTFGCLVFFLGLLASSLSFAEIPKAKLRPTPSVVPNTAAFSGYQKNFAIRSKMVKDYFSRYIDAYEKEYMATEGLKESPFPPDLKESILKAVDEYGAMREFPNLQAVVKTAMDRLAERSERDRAEAKYMDKLGSIESQLGKIQVQLDQLTNTPGAASANLAKNYEIFGIGVGQRTLILGIFVLSAFLLLISVWILNRKT